MASAENSWCAGARIGISVDSAGGNNWNWSAWISGSASFGANVNVGGQTVWSGTATSNMRVSGTVNIGSECVTGTFQSNNNISCVVGAPANARPSVSVQACGGGSGGTGPGTGPCDPPAPAGVTVSNQSCDGIWTWNQINTGACSIRITHIYDGGSGVAFDIPNLEGSVWDVGNGWRLERINGVGSPGPFRLHAPHDATIRVTIRTCTDCGNGNWGWSGEQSTDFHTPNCCAGTPYATVTDILSLAGCSVVFSGQAQQCPGLWEYGITRVDTGYAISVFNSQGPNGTTFDNIQWIDFSCNQGRWSNLLPGRQYYIWMRQGVSTACGERWSDRGPATTVSVPGVNYSQTPTPTMGLASSCSDLSFSCSVTTPNPVGCGAGPLQQYNMGTVTVRWQLYAEGKNPGVDAPILDWTSAGTSTIGGANNSSNTLPGPGTYLLRALVYGQAQFGGGGSGTWGGVTQVTKVPCAPAAPTNLITSCAVTPPPEVG